MHDANAAKDKNFAFAVRCVKFYMYLKEQKQVYDLARQLLRSGTSVGANIKEGLFAQSKADFFAKMSIAKKEAAETEYWLELLLEVGVLNEKEADSLLNDCRELIKILVSTCKSSKKGQSYDDNNNL